MNWFTSRKAQPQSSKTLLVESFHCLRAKNSSSHSINGAFPYCFHFFRCQKQKMTFSNLYLFFSSSFHEMIFLCEHCIKIFTFKQHLFPLSHPSNIFSWQATQQKLFNFSNTYSKDVTIPLKKVARHAHYISCISFGILKGPEGSNSDV